MMAATAGESLPESSTSASVTPNPNPNRQIETTPKLSAVPPTSASVVAAANAAAQAPAADRSMGHVLRVLSSSAKDTFFVACVLLDFHGGKGEKDISISAFR